MSSPDHGRGPEGAPATPTVSTAPVPAAAGTTAPDVAPGHRWWSAIPRNLGRARTSTVVLGLLFVGLFALYLTVRPPEPGSAPAAPDDGVEEPVTPMEPTEPTGTETDTETPAPTTTAPRTTTGPPPPPPRPTTPTTTGPPSPGGGATEPTTPETTAPAPTGGAGEDTAPDPPTG